MVKVSLNRRHKLGLFLALVATGVAFFGEMSTKQITGIGLFGIAFAWLLGSLSVRVLGLILFSLISVGGLYIAAVPLWEDRKSVRESAAAYDWAIFELVAAVQRARQFEVVPPETRRVPIPPGAQIDYDALAKKYGGTSSSIDPTAGLQTGQTKTIRVLSLGRFQIPADTGDDQVKQHLANSKLQPPSPEFPPDRTVEIPEIAQEWERPDLTHGGWTQISFEFSSKRSDADIIRELEKNVLRPRPTFSLMAAMFVHRWTFFGGIATLTLGLAGCGWLSRQRSLLTEPIRSQTATKAT